MQGGLLSDLRLPSHFAQAASALTEEESAQAVICGPDPARHIGELFLDRFALPGPLCLLQGERG
jgi:hypothetical protein